MCESTIDGSITPLKAMLRAALVLLVGVVPMQVAAQAQIEGEYGLWVTDREGELGVGWLTSSPEAGSLEVLSDGEVIYQTITTEESGAHFARFPRPEGEEVLLRYGAREASDRYETKVRLRDDPVSTVGVLDAVDSLFVVGDVHGEYDRLLGLLQNAGLVGRDGRWVGGERHVVFLGDIFDRGADVTKTLWFLYRLEGEAREAGGGAHVVLGNHETMIFTEDTRYVSAKEQLLARMYGVPYPELFDIRWSVLGRWLAGRPGVMKVDGVLLAHGGIVPDLGRGSVEALNDSIREFMGEDLFYRWADTTLALVTDSTMLELAREQYPEVIYMDSAAAARRTGLLFDERSILWYRGYVDADTLTSELEQVLADYDAELHVVAHTPVPTIESRYDGRLLAVDLLDPALEMLLLVRDPASGDYARWRIGLEGPPEPL